MYCILYSTLQRIHELDYNCPSAVNKHTHLPLSESFLHIFFFLFFLIVYYPGLTRLKPVFSQIQR